MAVSVCQRRTKHLRPDHTAALHEADPSSFRLNPSVIFGGICSASMSITFVCATKMTSAANAIILQFTHPVFLILILWIFYHKRPDKRAILTCIIALIGICMLFL